MSMSNEVLEVLRDGLERVERGWCQDTLARDEHGDPTTVGPHGAVSWCLLGALVAASLDRPLELVTRAADALAPYVGEGGLVGWNDRPGRTQEEVVGAIRSCIASMEEQA